MLRVISSERLCEFILLIAATVFWGAERRRPGHGTYGSRLEGQHGLGGKDTRRARRLDLAAS